MKKELTPEQELRQKKRDSGKNTTEIINNGEVVFVAPEQVKILVNNFPDEFQLPEGKQLEDYPDPEDGPVPFEYEEIEPPKFDGQKPITKAELREQELEKGNRELNETGEERKTEREGETSGKAEGLPVVETEKKKSEVKAPVINPNEKNPIYTKEQLEMCEDDVLEIICRRASIPVSKTATRESLIKKYMDQLEKKKK